MITVLFLAANPLDTARLRLDEEVRHITRSIRAAEFRDEIRIVPWFAARPDDLVQGLLEHRPQILHFSGHGDLAGEIRFIGDDGRSRPVGPEALRRILRVLRDVRVVVLNACHSAAQASLIAEQVDLTIGMSRAIGDRTATAFAGSFYRALGFGLSVEDAFELGVATLPLESIPGEDVPRLFVRDATTSPHLLLGGSPPATPQSWVQHVTSSAPGAIAQGAVFGNVINHPSSGHPRSTPEPPSEAGPPSARPPAV
jgi:hypothetical protein